MTDADTPVEFNEYMRLILLGRSSDPILEKSYSNKHSKRMREAVTDAHKYVLKKFNCQYLVGAMVKKLEGLNVPNWVKYTPQFMVENVYEEMKPDKYFKVITGGKILSKGWFLGIRRKDTVQYEKLPKEFIPYWKSMFINPKFSNDYKWEDGKDYEKLTKDLEKKTENATKGKVIKMPNQRRQNQEELYNFNVN